MGSVHRARETAKFGTSTSFTASATDTHSMRLPRARPSSSAAVLVDPAPTASAARAAPPRSPPLPRSPAARSADAPSPPDRAFGAGPSLPSRPRELPAFPSVVVAPAANPQKSIATGPGGAGAMALTAADAVPGRPALDGWSQMVGCAIRNASQQVAVSTHQRLTTPSSPTLSSVLLSVSSWSATTRRVWPNSVSTSASAFL